MGKKNEKIKEAVALQYSADENRAPKVIAIGKNELAEKIIEKAKDSNVPVYEDQNLAHSLAQLNIGNEIPPELYEVVAEVLVFISKIDQKFGEKHGTR